MYGDLGNGRQRGVEVSAWAVHVPSYTREWSVGCLVNDIPRRPTQIAQRSYDFSLFLLLGGVPLLFTCVISFLMRQNVSMTALEAIENRTQRTVQELLLELPCQAKIAGGEK
jgi:hypothetical protein